MTADRRTARPRRAGGDGDVVPARRAQRADPRHVGRAARHRPRTARRRPGGRGPRRGPGVLGRPRSRRSVAPASPPSPRSPRCLRTSAADADRRVPGGLHLAAPAGHRHASRPCRATRSAPASSSPSPVTCGCSPTDAQLSMAEVTLGLVPDLAGTKRLVELVGYARALEICADRPPDRRRRGRRGSGWPPWSCRRDDLDARGRRPGGGGARRQPRRGGRDQGAARRRRRTVRTPSRSAPSARRRPAGSATWPASGE